MNTRTIYGSIQSANKFEYIVYLIPATFIRFAFVQLINLMPDAHANLEHPWFRF